MSYETITYKASTDGVGHLRLNRPDGANAVCEAFARELREVMIEIEFDDCGPGGQCDRRGQGLLRRW